MFQRRQDASVSFHRTWNYYRSGFGDFGKNFWLGNDKIYRITAANKMSLPIKLKDCSVKKVFAHYDVFLRCKPKLLQFLTLFIRRLFTSVRNKFIVLSFAGFVICFFILSLLTDPNRRKSFICKYNTAFSTSNLHVLMLQKTSPHF